MRGDGRTYQRNHAQWICFYVNGKQHREPAKDKDGKTTHDAKVAERYLHSRVKEKHAAEIGAAVFVSRKMQRITVHDLLEALRAQFELGHKLSPQTKCQLARIDRDLGQKRAIALTCEEVDSYIQERLSAGAAPATVNRLTTLLARGYRLAIERKHLTGMPKITHLRENNARKGFFSRPEFDKVLGFLPENLRDYCLFGFLTGWRKGEISSLTWSNIHDAVIRLDAEASKNGEGRSVVVAGELVQVIERRQAARLSNGTLTNLVFHRNGEAIQEFRKSWASACRRAGFAGRLFHDLRRSAVRNLIRSGTPQFVAMSISGHKTVSMFKRYAITSEDDQRQAMLNVERYNRDAQTNVVAMK